MSLSFKALQSLHIQLSFLILNMQYRDTKFTTLSRSADFEQAKKD